MDGVSFTHRHEPANGLMAEGNEMADKVDVLALVAPGTEGMLHGYPATVIRHYGEGMYEFRMPRGEVCVDISYFTAKQP